MGARPSVGLAVLGMLLCAHSTPAHGAAHIVSAKFATKYEAERALWTYFTSEIGESGDDDRKAIARLPPPEGTTVVVGNVE